MGGHEEEAGRQPFRRAQSQQAVAAERRQGRIDERHVGASIAQEGERLARVAALAGELQLRALADDATQRVAEQRLRLDDGDARERRTGARWGRGRRHGDPTTVGRGREYVYV